MSVWQAISISFFLIKGKYNFNEFLQKIWNLVFKLSVIKDTWHCSSQILKAIVDTHVWLFTNFHVIFTHLEVFQPFTSYMFLNVFSFEVKFCIFITYESEHIAWHWTDQWMFFLLVPHCYDHKYRHCHRAWSIKGWIPGLKVNKNVTWQNN